MNPDPRPTSHAPKPPRRWPAVLGVSVILLIAYLASPYFSLWRFASALRNGDAAALSARVDFPRVRGELKRDLRKQYFPADRAPKSRGGIEGLIAGFGPSLIDQLVDSYLTPDGLAALLADPKIAGGNDPATASPPNSTADRFRARDRLDWSRVHYAFFTGPRDFLVELNDARLRFHLTASGWKLFHVELPLERFSASRDFDRELANRRRAS